MPRSVGVLQRYTMNRVTDTLLEERQLSLAETIVERAAFYDERLREAPPNQRDTFESLWAEYMISRIALVSHL